MADEQQNPKGLGAFLSKNPHNLAKIVKLRPEFTINMLTDGLDSVFARDPNAPPYVDPNTYHRFSGFLQLSVNPEKTSFSLEDVHSETELYFQREEAKELYLKLKEYFDVENN